MILPDRVFGRSSVNRIFFGLAIGPMVWPTWSRSSATSAVARLVAAAQDHERADGLAGGVVLRADHRGLGDRGVPDERVLDLGGRDVVTRHEHHVVDAAEQPVVAVVVALGAVAGEVAVAEAGPVGLLVALGVAPDAAQHRRPRAGEHEIAATGDLHRLTGVVDDVGGDAGERERRAPGLQRGGAGERADHDGAGLGLPPRVDDRAALTTDVVPVPDPRFGVDGLADAAEQPQRREVVRSGNSGPHFMNVRIAVGAV